MVDGADGAVAAIKQVGNATEQMEAKFAAVTSTVAKFTGIFSAMLGIAAGGAVFGSLVSETIRWNLEVGKLSKTLGITAQDASIFKVALHSVGIDQDVAISAAMRMAKSLNTNSDAFDQLGVKTRDSNGNQRDTLSVMMDTVMALGTYKGGLDRNEVAMQIFGKGWSEIQQLMKLNPALFEEARATAERLHLIVGPEGVAKSAMYKKSLNELELVGESLKIRLGDDLLPKLIDLSVKLGEAALTLADHFGPLVDALGAIVRVGGAYVLLFTGIPKLYAACAFAADAFAASTVNVAAANSVLMLSFTSSMPLLWQAVDGFTKLRIAGSVLMAAYAGFELGTWLYNQFDIVKKVSIAFTGGIMKLVHEAKFGFLELMAVGKGAIDWLKGNGYTGGDETKKLVAEHAAANAFVDQYMDEELAKLGKSAAPAAPPKPVKGKTNNPGPSQDDIDNYNQIVQKAHEQYLAYSKAFDDRVMAAIKEATTLQLGALEDRHSQGLISEQAFLDQKYAMEKDGLNSEADLVGERYLAIAKATAEAEKKLNASKTKQGGKVVYDDVLLSAFNKDSAQLEKVRQEYETFMAKIDQITQKYGQSSAKNVRDLQKEINGLTLENMKLQPPGNEKATAYQEIYNQYSEQVKKAYNQKETAANPEDKAQLQEVLDLLVQKIARLREIAGLDTDAIARNRDIGVIGNQASLAGLKGNYQDQIDLQLKLNKLKLDGIQADPKTTQEQKAALADLSEFERQQLELQKTPFGAYQAGLQKMYLDYSDTGKQMTTLAQSTAGAMTQGFDSFFFDAMQGKLKTFQDYFLKFITAIEQALAQVMAQKLTGSILGTVASSALVAHQGGMILHSGGLVPSYHTGGLVLPSFHFGGLNSDERPAVLLTHERVLSREQNKLFEKFTNKTEGSNGTIMVNAPVTISGGQGPGGAGGNAAELGRSIKTVISQHLNDQLRPGGLLYRG